MQSTRKMAWGIGAYEGVRGEENIKNLRVAHEQG